MSINCPNCAKEMASMVLGSRMAGPVTIDVCAGCQSFWFDKYESLQLSPASTLQVMKFIGEHSDGAKASLKEGLQCPRCAVTLRMTHDMQRNTHFSYWRCTAEHGRFIGFLDFLREKDFIRPLSPQEIVELRRSVQTVNCSNCGAAVDLAAGSVCAHCGSPISILDMNQPQQLLAQLQKVAQNPRPIEPLPETMFAPHGESASDETPSDLVQAGLKLVARWLAGRGSD